MITPTQIRMVVDQVRQYGTLSMAAVSAGLTPSQLKRELERDADFKEEVDDALSIFQDAIRLTVLERATTGRSDMMLKLAAESFVPDTFKPQADSKKIKVTGLRLRTFNEAGEEVGAPDTPVEKPTPSEPLQIELRHGL
jgi:hypothetical protein